LYIFQTKNSSLGKFWRVLQLKIFLYVCYAHLAFLHQFGIFCAHLVYFVVIWSIFPKEKIWQPCIRGAWLGRRSNVVFQCRIPMCRNVEMLKCRIHLTPLDSRPLGLSAPRKGSVIANIFILS
jgi:hypothetical protein